MKRGALIAAVAVALAGLIYWMNYGHRPVRPDAENGTSLGATTRVNEAGKGEDIGEIWAAADPADGEHLIACGMDSFPQQNLTNGFVYSSADGGASWRRTVLENATKFISEESCTFAGGSRAYFAAGESDTATGEPRHEWGHLRLFASDDHGMTWRPVWKRRAGWIDWTYMAAVPQTKTSAPTLVIFGNSATDRLGHWSDNRPVAVESTDGGLTFSGPSASTVTYIATFAGGSAVLPDGTALFISDAQKPFPSAEWANYPKHDFYAAVFAYSPRTHRLAPRAIIRQFHGRTVSTGPALVQDTSTGPFHGRLYAAWSESGPLDSRLWLATSDDGGFHWVSRPIYAGVSVRTPSISCRQRTVGEIKLAVDGTGTLGVAWDLNYARLLFAASRDGGRHFSQGTILAQHGQTPFTIQDSVTFDEYWLREVQLVNAGKWDDAVADIPHLGFSVRMGQYSGIFDYALVADAKNTFHAIWNESDPDGNHGLLTRTVEVAGEARQTPSLVDVTAMPCQESGVTLRVPTPQPSPRLQMAGQQDITKSVVLQARNVRFDASAKTLSADVTLTNAAKATIGSGVSFVAVGLHSDYGVPVPLNASGSIQGQPFWDASKVMPAGGLTSHKTSLPLRLQFKLANFRPLPGNYAASGGDAVAMRVFIYQKAGK